MRVKGFPVFLAQKLLIITISSYHLHSHIIYSGAGEQGLQTPEAAEDLALKLTVLG